jgi:hypothetical protein
LLYCVSFIHFHISFVVTSSLHFIILSVIFIFYLIFLQAYVL